jgi:hypothetical protein
MLVRIKRSDAGVKKEKRKKKRSKGLDKLSEIS